MAEQSGGAVGEIVSNLPTDRLKDGLKGAAGAYAERGLHKLADKVGGKGGDNGNKKSGSGPKVTNIVEDIDVGVPVRLAYDLWTQYQDWPSFMKKVERADHRDDNEVLVGAKVFWSSRSWTAEIVEQVPDERIVWRSSGQKGHVDGTVTFHELGPRLTKILVVLEYYPHGFFEKTGNLWRAQGRRARLELKHFRRQAMSHTLLDPDSVEGWRGEIRDSEVVRSHEDALEEEEGGGDEPRDEDEDREDDEEPPEDEADDEADEDEEEDEEEPLDEDEEYDEEEEEEQPAER
ncbi:MAG: SRPBCC family protein [Streptosporangiales bacterium]|nr:SRPBCC family protein [Streptosporangiales bacterium]MBO0889690.1 SRPBCC family protein [Acidothermales bacterium]